MRRIIVFLMLLAAQVGPSAAQDRVQVIASFSILADIVREVGGNRLNVHTLVPPDGNAHVFQPTPTDARFLAQADVLVANGLNFEVWLDRLVTASGFRGHRIVAAAGIRALPMGAHSHADGHDHGHGTGAGGKVPDPHVWHDLRRMRSYVLAIADGLAVADPAHAQQYRTRADAYIGQLQALDQWAEQMIGSVPRAHRKAITQHEAFGYLADRFLIDFMAPQGASMAADASADQVARLLRQIKSNRVQALFFENVANPRLIEQIARDARVRVGGRLYSDALSLPGGEADTFIKMYRVNIERLTETMRRTP